jgi:hypothetical protein
LLSSGGFAVYRSEVHAFEIIGPRFNQLRRRSDVEEFLDIWTKSMLCQRTGLDKEILRERLLYECRSPARFLQVVMESIAGSQGVNRWAECTPENLLFMRDIKQHFPDARFLHIIRDGRDVALSLEKQRWISPLPIHNNAYFLASLFYWRWIVTKGRLVSKSMRDSYHEVRYESLVSDPRKTLAEIAGFIDHDLDFDKIRQCAIGSVSDPNTSFTIEGSGADFSPIGRWKRQLSAPQVAVANTVAGKLLKTLGYCTVTPQSRWKYAAYKMLAKCYDAWFSTKLWAKTRTKLAKYTDIHLIKEQDP